jgi:D-3-phosphoglycerate dehydrogenase/(S)-sulfolactate dehydrogenase
MTNPVVLITSRSLHPGDEADQELRANGVEVRYAYSDPTQTEAELIALLQGVDGVIAGGDRYTANVLAATDRLKIIARTGIGYDLVDVAAATARGIYVCNTPGSNRHSVAEWASLLLLMCAKRAADNFAAARNGPWTQVLGVDLAGRTLGIIGLGTIGKEVAQRMRAFEMRILAYDVRPDPEFAAANGVEYVSLERLLAESDFVTIHCFLNATTRHLLNAERIALMKPTAYLVNAARGGIVDTAALVGALRDKRLAGAALDVFEQEPLPLDSPLRDLDNVVIAPHAAGASHDAHVAARQIAAADVLRAVRGERPINLVNREVVGRAR